MTLTSQWIDGMREPTQKPNPAFPRGVDINLTQPGERTCTMKLPYPARRIGHHYVSCDVCGTNALITTAGRVDDPRSITLPCKEKRTP